MGVSGVNQGLFRTTEQTATWGKRSSPEPFYRYRCSDAEVLSPQTICARIKYKAVIWESFNEVISPIIKDSQVNSYLRPTYAKKG